MQMSVVRNISQGEVVADLCSCNKLLEENMSDEDIKDCFFVYQVMGDHIDCLTPEGVDSLDEALRLFFANRMWRHCYIEDKNHAQVDISAQIEGFENYLASWDEDGYFDWVEDSNKDDDEYMSDDDAEYEADWDASTDDDDPEWDLQCSDDATWEAQEMSDEEFLAKAKALGLNTDMPEVDFVRKYLPDAGIVECIDRYMEYTMYRDEGQSDIVSRQYAGLL